MKKTTKKAFNVAIASAMAAGAVVAVAPAQVGATLAFSDVKEANVHYTDILNLAERGIINGFSDGTFRPGDSIKRGHAAKIIAGVLGLDTVKVTNPNFKDVTTSTAEYGSIAALANAGIINGFEDGTYRANDTLTRGQMAKIIANAFELVAENTTVPFTDVANSIYKTNIAALYEAKVTTGVSATKFDEKSAVTRAQLASFVVRAEAVNTASTVEKTAKVISVDNDKVTIDGEELEIATDLKAVFNIDNAAALQDSEVLFVIEYVEEKVAALTPVANVRTGKVVGIKSLKLVKDNTAFDAKGFTIPTLTVGAKNVTISNVVTTTIQLLKGAVASFKNVKAATVEIPTGAKITLDKESVLEKIVLDNGQKLEDVIANFNEVKDLLANVKIENKPAETNGGGSGSTSGGAGGGSGSGGGSGGGTAPSVDLDAVLDKAIGAAIGQYTTGYATFALNSATNVITVTITNDSTTLTDVRADLKTKADGLSLTGLLAELSFTEAGAILDNVSTVTAKAGTHTATYTVSDYINTTALTVDKAKVVADADQFIDNAIKASDTSVVDLSDVVKVFNDNVSVTVGNVTYTVKVVSAK